MPDFRFILDEYRPAPMNMAVDEAVMRLAREQTTPTIRFYGWKPSAISIGYFQSLEQEVDLKKCGELGVDFVRRITGGGAVFHDAELTYSFVCTENSNVVPKKIIDSYQKICGALVKGFGEMGLDAKFVPINDIIVNGKKISGNAQTRREGVVLQHGTVLLEVDVDKMFSLLKVPSEKMRGKLIEDVKQRVTSVEEQLNRKMSFGRLAEFMKKGFEKEFSARLLPGKFSQKELDLAKKIEKERFGNREWNFKR